MTTYFDAFSASLAEYENEDIPKIHLTAEEPPWDPSTSEYSRIEACILGCQGQIIIPATMARELIHVCAVISYSLAYDAVGHC